MIKKKRRKTQNKQLHARRRHQQSKHEKENRNRPYRRRDHKPTIENSPTNKRSWSGHGKQEKKLDHQSPRNRKIFHQKSPGNQRQSHQTLRQVNRFDIPEDWQLYHRTSKRKGEKRKAKIWEQWHSTDEMNDVEDKEETFHTITLSKHLSSKTRPHNSRTAIEEEIRYKLLEEVRKDVSAIQNKIEDISIKNRKLR
jgi:hypothetical protein